VNVQQKFGDYEEALAFVRNRLIQTVAEEARMAGAESAQVEYEESKIWDGMAHLSAWAIGTPGLNGSVTKG
jgi:hypothetical protein